MKERIITIQLEYIFDSQWAAAVHRNGSTKIYLYLTESSWLRILNLRPKKQSGTLDGRSKQFDFS